MSTINLKNEKQFRLSWKERCTKKDLESALTTRSKETKELRTVLNEYVEKAETIVRKRETIMAQSLEDKIIGLYGLGTSLRDISAHIKEAYDTDISAATLSSITDKVTPFC